MLSNFVHYLLSARVNLLDLLSLDTGYRHHRGFNLYLRHVVYEPE